MKKYEAVFIFDESKLESSDQVAADAIAAYIESLGGKIELSETMGRRTFATPIKKKNAGVYWNFVFELNPNNVKSIEENYRLDESVLRMAVFVYDRPENPITLSAKH